MKRHKILLASVLLLAGLAAATTPTGLRFLTYWGARAAANLPSRGLDSRTFDSGGVQLRYVVAGTGEPVVLVHGFASNVEHNWRRTGVIDALVRGFPQAHLVGYSRGAMLAHSARQCSGPWCAHWCRRMSGRLRRANWHSQKAC